MSDAEMHRTPGALDMHDVMQAKLAYTQAVVEAIAMSDFDRIDRSAMALVDISMQGEWMVHDTMAYVGFSDRFRDTARKLSSQAKVKDMPAVTETYGELIDTCVACHEYLRRERMSKDMPGRVSQAEVKSWMAALGMQKLKTES
jgi:hypothetical protein